MLASQPQMQQRPRRKPRGGRTFSCAVTHCGLAHFCARAAAAAAPAGIAIVLGVNELGSSFGRRRGDACESGATGAAAQQAVPRAHQACAAGGTGAERRRCAHSRAHHRLQPPRQHDASARAARVVRIGVDDGDQARVGCAVGENSKRFASLRQRNGPSVRGGRHGAPHATTASDV